MTAGIIVILVGVVFFLKNLGYLAVVSWDLIWPLIVVIVGIGMISRRCKNCGMWGCHRCDSKPEIK